MPRGLALAIPPLLALLVSSPARAADCNSNGRDDLEDIRSAPLTFQALSATTLSGSVRALATIDFDRDGLEDIAVATTGGDEVVVLLQRGASFVRGARAGTISPPLAVAAADFDGDGDSDLVLSGENPLQISLARNAGPDGLSPEEVMDLPAALTALAAADLDGDGDIDIAGASSFEVHVLRNDGTGRFEMDAPIRIGSNPVSITAFDLDADGDVDLATANTLDDPDLPGNISIVRNRGEGVFDPARNLAASPDPRAIAALDANGDGRLDLASAGTQLELYTNLGDGAFAEAETLASGLSAKALCRLDANRDGHADLALSSSETRRLQVFMNGGDGTFSGGPSRDLPAEPRALVSADFDGDGDDDIAAGGGPLSFFFFESGQLSAESFPAGGRTSVHVAADIDGDGDPDISSGEEIAPIGGSVRLLMNDGTGEFEAGPTADAGGLPYRMVLVDVEKDGDLDVAVTTNNGQVVVLGNNGTALVRLTALDVGGNVTALAAGDVNGDGRDDLIVGSESLGLTLFGGTPSSFTRGANLPFTGMFPYFTAAADLDGDGRVDLASVTGDTHKLVIHWNQGGSLFTRAPPMAASTYPFQVAPVDLDGDGDLDLAIVHYGGEGASTFENEGGRSFILRTVTPAGRSPMSIVAADLDRDGDPDLACAGDELSLLLNQGGGVFEPGKRVVPVDGHFAWLSAADFDGDGTADLGMGVNSFQGGGLSVFLSRSRVASSRDADGNLVPDECQKQSFRRGDADAGGSLDLTDALAVLRHLFLGDPPPSCLDAADADDSGELAITDAVHVLGFLFLGGPPPPFPGPPPESCSFDPLAGTSLGCAEYPGC